jgi:phosphonate transport system substrate-binding protein
LDVKWQTKPLVNNSWVARSDLPPELVQRFARALIALKDTESGRRLLARVPVSAMEPATDATYQPVRTFLDKFARQVRPIEH